MTTDARPPFRSPAASPASGSDARRGEPEPGRFHGPVEGARGSYELTRRQVVERPLTEVFAFFSEARNLELLTPPWLSFRILDAPGTLEAGSLIRYRLRLGGIPVGWTSEITEWRPPHCFTDVQRRGPYALWEHTHRFRQLNGTTELHDRVIYRLPGGPLGPLVRATLVRRQLERIFDYRAERVAELFSAG